MPKTERYILYVIILGFIVWFFLRKPVNTDDANVTVSLKYDSIPTQINSSTIEKPVVIKQGEFNIPEPIIEIMQGNDTALLRQVLHEVLARYYEERVQHTTTADTNIIVETWDSITENAIYGRKLQYKWLRPTEVKIVQPTQRNKVFGGIYLEAGANGLYSIAPELSFENKKGMLLRLNYNAFNLATGKDKYSFGVGISQKISFRKK